MNRFAPLASVAAAFLFLTTPVLAAGPTSQSLVVQVYSDGSTFITQKISVSSTAATVEIPLLSSVLSNVVATDQNGSPLSFKISGPNITVYTLGSTGVTLRYDTLNLTSKTGTVWRLDFVTAYNATVILPKLSTLSFVSGTPYSIQVQNDSPVASIGPGSWEISYGVSIGSIPGTNSTGGSPVGPLGGLSWTQLAEIGGGAVVVAAGLLAFRWWRRRIDIGPRGGELRQDDVQVLNFIQEKGGKVLESEIRTRFALPKTSAWRQIKRLERMGRVKVVRVGSQNQIELLRGKET